MIEFEVDVPSYWRRIRGALFRAALLSIVLIIIEALILAQIKIDLNSFRILELGTSIITLLLIVIALLSQVRILSSISVDPKSKKVWIKVMRFNKVISLGEYDIDDDLNVGIKIKEKKLYRRNGTVKDILRTYYLDLKSSRKKIWSEKESEFLEGISGWTVHKFYDISNTINAIKTNTLPVKR